MNRPRGKKGVICRTAVAVILFAGGFSAISRAERPRPPKFDTKSDLQQLGAALLMYSQDYDDLLPPMKDLHSVHELLGPYLSHSASFIDPSSQIPFAINFSLSARELKSVYRESFAKKQATIAWYQAKPNSSNSRLILKLPMPDFYEQGEPCFRFSKATVKGYAVGIGSAVEHCKVENITQPNWARVKHSSGIK